MKNILVALLVVSSSLSWAQNKGPNSTTQSDNAFASFEQDRGTLGRAKAIVRTGKVIDGSKYLWEGWNQIGQVQAVNGKKYSVSKVNFNAKNNWFEINVDKDTIYSFDRRKIAKVVIDDRTFINMEFPENERTFVVEEIAKGADFLIVKKYDIEILYGSHDPMRGSTRDKYKLLDDYYIKNNNGLEKINPKKSSITKLFGKNAKAVSAYAKKEKLSFKNDKELAKIISYGNTL